MKNADNIILTLSAVSCEIILLMSVWFASISVTRSDLWWRCWSDCCRLNMTKVGPRYWNVGSFTLEYTNQTEHTVQLDPTFVAVTPVNFSYHCSDPDPVRPVNVTTPDVAGISVKFNEFQVRLWTGRVDTVMQSRYLCNAFCREPMSSVKWTFPFGIRWWLKKLWSQWMIFCSLDQFFDYPSVLWHCWLHYRETD